MTCEHDWAPNSHTRAPGVAAIAGHIACSVDREETKMPTNESTARASTKQGNSHGVFAGYSPQDPMPLGGYATLLGVWATGVGAFLAAFHKRLPARMPWSDVALLSVATHKVARIVTKDFVTSPLRAPFVRYQSSLGAGEVEEKARGTGLRRAVGDLLTCNWCIAPWIAATLAAGLVLRPRATRFLASIFSAVAVSDALQHAYNAEKRLSRS